MLKQKEEEAVRALANMLAPYPGEDEGVVSEMHECFACFNIDSRASKTDVPLLNMLLKCSVPLSPVTVSRVTCLARAARSQQRRTYFSNIRTFTCSQHRCYGIRL